MKGMDDFMDTEALCTTTFRDQWIINNNKINPDFKAWLKKAKIAKQK